MPANKILDSHIHLWPESAANSSGHGWMTPGFLLSKEHVISNYVKAAPTSVKGVVYVETDRRLEAPVAKPLDEWAAQPVEELLFLKSIVEEKWGSDPKRDSALLKAIVPWAPMNQSKLVFEEWLSLAERTAGPATWSRVKGFRFLLQAITDRDKFESLVFSDAFIAILKSFHGEGRNFSFDVGVDMRSGGIWQLEAFAEVIERVRSGVADDQKTVFILNHMCKPDFTIGAKATEHDDGFARWKTCITRLASVSDVYMKFSGAFSELSADGSVNVESKENPGPELAQRLKPWTDAIFDAFGPERIMFGSDWPVCNVKGPDGEQSWSVWTVVVEAILEERELSEAQKDRIWSGTACEAYKLNPKEVA